ncbi:hypothetical protein AGMMS49982_00320 [Bacteroidia bacterium]|nr:hypothetical protein AGMMS49982_00320 [Bacteroidia bacterium]
MKKTIALILVTVALCGCDSEEYYMEGRVNTFDATEIAATSSILSGSLEILHESSETNCEVQSTGFEISENAAFTNPKELSAGKTRGNFKAAAENLKPNTKHYVRAFATLSYLYSEYPSSFGSADKFTKTFYGNTVEFTTIDGIVPENPTNDNPVSLIAAGLMIQKTDIGTNNWSSINSLCENSIVAGYTDWRLPTKDELATMYSEKNTIGGFTTDWYWTSESYSNASWGQSFSNGTQNLVNSSSTYRGRCVRTLP